MRRYLIAALVAPLAVPAIFFVTFTLYFFRSVGLMRTLAGALFLTASLSVVTYGVTIFIGVPILFLASRVVRLNALVVLLAGALAALIAYLPLTWLEYQTTGNNSGPPDSITPLQFLHWALDGAAVFILAFIIVGLMTSAAFYFLSGMSGKHRKTIPEHTAS
jgi:hypothetical protein